MTFLYATGVALYFRASLQIIIMQNVFYDNLSLKQSGGTIGPFKIIEKELRRVKDTIEQTLANYKNAIGSNFKPVKNMILDGKMLRPALLMLSARTVGKITRQHINCAVVIELLHNATLLHDDVIDESSKRRHVPTANTVLGNKSAVLIGDFLFSRVFDMCAKLQPDVSRVISETTSKICTGEMRQSIGTAGISPDSSCEAAAGEPLQGLSNNTEISETDYIDIISQKSASLFSCACRLGAALAHTKKQQVNSLSRFGLEFGIAFQIADDLIDIIGDEQAAGKTLGADITKNKLTLPMIHLLSKADDTQKNTILKLYAKGTKDRRQKLIEDLERSGSLRYTAEIIRQFATRAISRLDNIDDCIAKNALIETTNLVATPGIDV